MLTIKNANANANANNNNNNNHSFLFLAHLSYSCPHRSICTAVPKLSEMCLKTEPVAISCASPHILIEYASSYGQACDCQVNGKI